MSPAPTTSMTALIAGATFSLLMGLNTNIDVTRLDAVIFGMWNRHEKRKDSQDHYRKPHYK